MDDQEKKLLEEIHSAVADDESQDSQEQTVVLKLPIDQAFTKAVDELKATTSEKLDQVVAAVKKVEAKAPVTSVKVSNLHEIEPSPEDVRVTNLKDIVIPKPPNEVDVKQPKWWKPVDLSAISASLKRLIEVVTKLEVPTDDPKKPIAVRLSDGESFYKALEYVLQNSGGSGGSALTWMDSKGGPTRASTQTITSNNVSREVAQVAVVDSTGTQVTSFGGTQYTDAAATPAHPSGIMPMWDNAGTISETSLAKGLPVQPATGASFGSSTADQAGFVASTTTGGISMGVFQTTPDTIANNKAAAVGIDTNRNLKVTEATKLAGEDLTNDVMKVEQRFSASNLLANATTTIKSGAGFLHCITINTHGAAANTVSIFDNTAGSGTSLGIIDTTSGDVKLFDVSFSTGLTVVIATGTAANITVSYR